MRCRLDSMLVAIVLFAASEVHAGSCLPGQSPFSDVPESGIFCAEALWLRNALVTLGCGAGTAYCPFEPVSRAQMALFMKRLATAVTPDIVYSDVASTSSGDLDGGGYATCVTSPYAIPSSGANARIISHAIGTVSILTDAAADILVQIQMSVDGGLFQTFAGNTPRVLVQPNQWTVVPVMGGYTILGGNGIQLIPGSTYQWRILMQREGGGSTTGEVTGNRCQVMINLPVESAT